MRKFPTYEDGLAVLLGLTGGLVLFDRGAINFLAPFIVKELHLSDAQLGLAASVVSLSWAGAGFAIGRLSDATGRRKPLLIAGVVLFSLCSVASGLAGGFIGLLAARLLMGLGEGPTATLSNALIMEGSSPSRRGLNMGVNALLGVVLGAALAPPIVVGLATHFGWRAAFFVAGAPGLIAGLAILFYVRERAIPAADAGAPQPALGAIGSPLDVLRVRNVWLCALTGTLMVAAGSVAGTFLPLFLVQVRHLSVTDMGVVMGVGGGGMLAVPVVFALSDRFGRKPLMIACAAACATLPLGFLNWAGGVAGLAAFCFVAIAGAGAGALSIAIVPAESVETHNRGTALGIVMGVAEIAGGFAAPALAGVVADRAGLAATLVIAGACAFAAMLLSLLVRETAPRRLQAAAGLGRPALAPSE